MDSTRVANLITRFPLLLPTITTLNTNGINWMIGGSGCLYLFGNERLPEDVDILLPNDQHDKVDELFNIESFTYTSPLEHVRNSNPESNHDLQFTSHLTLSIEGQNYQFDFGLPFIQKEATTTTLENQTFRIAPPEEALFIKALLQRGAQEGKHDLEDIANFLTSYPSINKEYIRERSKQLQAETRIKNTGLI